jgi:hypothetical protein
LSNTERPAHPGQPQPEFARVAGPLLHDLTNSLGSMSLRVSFVRAQVVEAEQTGRTDWVQARADLDVIAGDLKAAAAITATLHEAVITAGPDENQSGPGEIRP